MNKKCWHGFKYLLVLLVCSPVVAEETRLWAPGSNFATQKYAGLQFSSNEVALLTGTRQKNNVTTDMSADNSDIGYGLVVGANYNSYMDIEARYQSLGMYTHQLDYADANQSVQTRVDSDLEYQALSLLLRPKYLIGRGFTLEAEAGLAYARFERESTVAVSGKRSQAQLEQLEQDLQNSLGSDSDNELALTYGFGLSYQGKDSPWQWRYSLQYLSLEEEISVLGLSLLRSF